MRIVRGREEEESEMGEQCPPLNNRCALSAVSGSQGLEGKNRGPNRGVVPSAE